MINAKELVPGDLVEISGGIMVHWNMNAAQEGL
jgi:hypothetical protein